MELCNIWSVIETYQTLIAGLVGFLGVILALWFSSKATRRRDQWLRQSEVDAIAAAFYGEIIMLREAIADRARVVVAIERRLWERDDFMAKFDDEFVERTLLPRPLMYESLAPRIGILPSKWVLSLSEFYSNLEEMRNWLPRLGDKNNRGISHFTRVALEPAERAVLGVKPLLREIEDKLGIVPPAGDPEFAQVVQQIEEEKAIVESSRGLQTPDADK
ncbi:MAG: hypothetical protein KDE31_01860 [Caldilineaceae bacterium]|nr:hypothetical protein [Caldilineaceae bacterium]